MVYDFVVREEASGKRLDLFLAQELGKEYSRSFLARLISDQAVALNNTFVKPHHKVKAGESIHVVIPQLPRLQVSPEDIPLKIIYEDEDVLVIDKPSGLVVHPGVGNQRGTLVNGLLKYTRNLSSINPERPGIVHRLDKETSGVMVVAKTNPSHLNLAKQFAKHTIQRKYIAIVSGCLELDEGVIDLPIGRHARDFRRLAVCFTDSGRYAITRYKVTKRAPNATVLELTPETGRTHQLRVHLAHIGHAILGDTKYGKPSEFSRLALHAQELGFVHPKTKAFVSFSSELPVEFVHFYGEVKKHLHLLNSLL